MKTKQELHLAAAQLYRKRERLASKLHAIDLEIAEAEKVIFQAEPIYPLRGLGGLTDLRNPCESTAINAEGAK